MIVMHIRSIGFGKIFGMAKSDCSEFEVGTTLRGIVIDWSDAEADGLRKAVGDIVANRLLKGCQVYWARSYQRLLMRYVGQQKRRWHTTE